MLPNNAQILDATFVLQMLLQIVDDIISAVNYANGISSVRLTRKFLNGLKFYWSNLGYSL